MQCFRKLSLNSTTLFALQIHFSFGARLLAGVEVDLALLSDNSWHFHGMIVSTSQHSESLRNRLKYQKKIVTHH